MLARGIVPKEIEGKKIRGEERIEPGSFRIGFSVAPAGS
jgi:hypothetical protein